MIIKNQIQDLYDVEISAEMVSKITDRILPLVAEWQHRPLESVYSFIFLDAIHYKIRDEKQIVNKAAEVYYSPNKIKYEICSIWRPKVFC